MDNTKIKALILDMDGVIWRNKQPIGDLESIFSTLIKKQIKYAFATNNSTKTVASYVEFLTSLGIPVTSDQIYTSGKATAEALAGHFPQGGSIYVVGMSGLKETISQYGFTISEENPLAVVAALDTEVTYDKLKTAALLIRSGVPFIGTNPDKTFPTPNGLAPDAGAVLALLTAASDVEPEIIGKPKAAMFRQALEHLQEDPEDVLVVGDRLDTDIAGGQAAGCKTAVVLTGVSSQEQASSWKPAPDIIISNLTELVESL